MTPARSRSIVVRPFAKLNLTLDVGPRRPDGFHDVKTVMQAISITDRLVMTRRRGPFVLRAFSSGLAVDRTNLIYRAAASLWRAMGEPGEPRDLDVLIHKRIPMAAGLGGGSADAAATLVCANRLWRAGLGPARLADLAARLGSDVPFFLCGGAALGVGRGETLYPLADSPRLEAVVVKPDFGVATADAYRWFDGEPRTARPARGRAVELGWPAGPLQLSNSLQAPVGKRHPEIGHIVKTLLAQGALAAAMSGSGSAVFGLFASGQGVQVQERLQKPGWTVLVGRTLTRRESGRLIGL
jgi:4-diphosphocytidyl-2-C-methyl-D-erythritol kinase